MENSLRNDFLAAMSRAACTVSIVTTDGPAGRSGATVSAMSSVSADGEAPTLLVCLHQNSVTAQAIRDNGGFCVNVLRDDQSAISDRFAGRLDTTEGKFAGACWETGPTGFPRLHGGLVSFDCRLASEQKVGTHHVFIGAVVAVTAEDEGLPLIYSGRAYARPARLDATGLRSA
ncbi:flavin reductase family protein [Rhizobiaceae bacterium BDR2-2]|uniref:Flavin reductase family protein n=1 Tax=Ectorhizobium quercum TaxID=2965071 RepID=A0AAE3SV86_9HYPH|nr:flavin reductase family protein [Ectorhizobium quercum]MCX8997927.1 flavin reductase family protein [Ectorhizobium quercum]